MAKIYSPNSKYTGISASVSFANGVGETNDKHLIAWFKAKGYSINKPFGDTPGEKGFSSPDNKIAQLQTRAKELGIKAKDTKGKSVEELTELIKNLEDLEGGDQGESQDGGQDKKGLLDVLTGKNK